MTDTTAPVVIIGDLQHGTTKLRERHILPDLSDASIAAMLASSAYPVTFDPAGNTWHARFADELRTIVRRGDRLAWVEIGWARYSMAQRVDTDTGPVTLEDVDTFTYHGMFGYTADGTSARLTFANGDTARVSHVDTDPPRAWVVDAYTRANGMPVWSHGTGERITAARVIADAGLVDALEWRAAEAAREAGADA